ncbi:MAG: hypothetical protein KBD94_04580 [Pyrinomonadaceae bacterium]|nr:hypothetical protein [Pyrinomonadaceae bacterium]
MKGVPSIRAVPLAIVSILLFALSALAQKGVDSQTKTIKDDGNKVTTRSSDATRSFDWGKGKTKLRDQLANPYRLSGRRDLLIDAIVEVLREKKIVVDDASSRPGDGIIVTQPFVFAKGAVVASSELRRYALLDEYDSAWTRGQYTLTIEVQSIDGVQNNVSVNAKIEGRAGAGLGSEWRTLKSSGVAEDEFLAKLVEHVTGSSVEPVQDTENK